MIQYDIKYYDYLDELRASGDTNMYGAGAYLEAEFDLEKKESANILTDWMDTFSERHQIKGAKS